MKTNVKRFIILLISFIVIAVVVILLIKSNTVNPAIEPLTYRSEIKKDAVGTINVNGLLLEVPQNWGVAKSNFKVNPSDTEPAYYLFSPEYTHSVNQTVSNNSVSVGAEIFVDYHTSRLKEDVSSAEGYQGFLLSKLYECKNCISREKVVINGSAAAKISYKFDDFGGGVSYHGFNNGKIFKIGIAFPDNYETHKVDFEEFISKIKFE